VHNASQQAKSPPLQQMEKTPAGPTDSAHHAGLHVAATEGKDVHEQPPDDRDGRQQQPSPPTTAPPWARTEAEGK
jgi:hypothetical protein